MRIQASTEFLLILSAISILALAAITMYNGKLGAEHSELASSLSLSNTSSSVYNSANPSNIDVIAYIPMNSVVGSENDAVIAFYGCGNGIGGMSIYSSNLAFSSNSINNMNISGIGIANIQFVPLMQGLDSATLKYNGICEGSEFNGTLDLLTYSAQSQGPYTLNYSSQQQAYAYITSRKEVIVYNQTSPMQVSGINVWSHCNYDSFITDNPSPAQACGTNNGWVYESFNGYCYSMNYGPSNPTCMVPYSTSYETSAVESDYSESYSFSLLISYEGLLFNASINSQNAKVYLGNTIVGNASVTEISGVGPITDAFILYNSSKSGFANPTAYQAYVQAKNNMYNTLSYYNMSSVSGPVISHINEVIASYQKAASELEGSQPSNITGCAISNGTVECKPLYPFSYTINVTLSKPSSIKNMTLYYQGSIISIKQV
ncbi:MAG: hypothetical protein ACP5RF_02605 [Candidatus Micrarchaeia archaeon]